MNLAVSEVARTGARSESGGGSAGPGRAPRPPSPLSSEASGADQDPPALDPGSPRVLVDAHEDSGRLPRRLPSTLTWPCPDT